MRGRLTGRRSWTWEREAWEEGGELPCVTAILVDSWSALFHISPYCLLGGLSGGKQVSAQIASENISRSARSFSPCVSYDGPPKHGYPSLPCSLPM